jgi:Domain of unknown function (DUF4832)/Domain of unknown function (DUF4874)
MGPLGCLMALLCVAAQLALGAGPISVVDYEASTEDFPNPERGFYSQLLLSDHRPGSSLLSTVRLESLRLKNQTGIRRLYEISGFRDRDLSPVFLDTLSRDFDAARKAGFKLILRFGYDFTAKGQDAPKEVILRHLDQLKPVFEVNTDVIAFLEAGFVGAWGEWHSSSHGLDKDSEAKREIVLKQLEVLPKSRMTSLRTARYREEVFGSEAGRPLTLDDALRVVPRVRVGYYNDCFLGSDTDVGTYLGENETARDAEKDFIARETRFVVQGGETCGVSPPRSDCATALAELALMHWSYLNSSYHPGVLKAWRAQGCMEEISRRLGYRFHLVQSSVPGTASRGGELAMSFEISNEGFASPYNPRLVELVLREPERGVEYILKLEEDPRMWASGETRKVSVRSGIPPDMPPGRYGVFLNLPDPAPSLYGRPEYSIRLANSAVWQPETGYNSLRQRVKIQSAAGKRYAGRNWFVARKPAVK